MSSPPDSKSSKPDNTHQSLDLKKLEIETMRLNFERQKLAIDSLLRRKELRTHRSKTLKELFSNPLTLAIIGGILTLLTSIVTNLFNSSAQRSSDSRRLQSDLIKSLIDVKDVKVSSENLKFLVESGLIPDYQESILQYKITNPESSPILQDKSQDPTPLTSAPPVLNLGSNFDPNINRTEPIGVSIHLGVNEGRLPDEFPRVLHGAIPDANEMQKLAAQLDYRTNLLTDRQASKKTLLFYLDRLSTILRPSDHLFLTMAGTGTQVSTQLESEPDKLEEAWLMYDGLMRASELHQNFAKFPPGVTIIIVQDCCNPSAFRTPTGSTPLQANLIVLACAEEDQMSYEVSSAKGMGGLYTSHLISIWNQLPAFDNYTSFNAAIANSIDTDIQSGARLYMKPKIFLHGDVDTIPHKKPFSFKSP